MSLTRDFRMSGRVSRANLVFVGLSGVCRHSLCVHDVIYLVNMMSCVMAHTDPLFGKLNILKFKDILDVNSKIFMHKYFNSQLPGSFNNMFTPFAEPNRTKNFILEKPRNKRLETFPKAFLPKCWNALSLDHKNTISHSSFKKYIREDLINEYNEFTCTNNNCSSCSI